MSTKKKFQYIENHIKLLASLKVSRKLKNLDWDLRPRGKSILKAEERGKNTKLYCVMNPFIILLMKLPGRLGAKSRKAFGNLTYDMDMSR